MKLNVLKKMRNFEKYFRDMFRRHRYECISSPDLYPMGSELWLCAAEKHFGGIVRRIKRNKFSELEEKHERFIGHSGGDRMFHQKYGKRYSKHLKGFVAERHKAYTVVEAGILKGTGLAIWSSLFPQADLIGLDIDLQNYSDNFEFLKSQGAFPYKKPETHEFDQFQDNRNYLATILKQRKVDIFIDDGCHLDETIIKTARSVRPYLSDNFVYFVEDNSTVFDQLTVEFAGYSLFSYKGLTVISGTRSQAGSMGKEI